MCFNVALLLRAKDCDRVFVSNDPVNLVDPWGLTGAPGYSPGIMDKHPANAFDIANQWGKNINYVQELSKLSQEYAQIAAKICKGESENYCVCVDVSGEYSLHKGSAIMFSSPTQCGCGTIDGTKDCCDKSQ